MLAFRVTCLSQFNWWQKCTSLQSVWINDSLGKNSVRPHKFKHQTFYYLPHHHYTSRIHANGPGLENFLSGVKSSKNKLDVVAADLHHPYISADNLLGNNRKVYFDVRGCQMNVNDTEIVWSILKSFGYQKCESAGDADVIFIVTCSVREGAEKKIWNKLEHLRHLKKRRRKYHTHPPLKVGILGCMAERLKNKLLESEGIVDLVAGPDSYRDLPRLLSVTTTGQTAFNVQLSLEETYADIVPVRLNQQSVTAFISVMRGCDNMCSYCIVPFTRGRERSRPMTSILDEVKRLSEDGIREVTLLGQNVNSYRDVKTNIGPHRMETRLSPGFSTIYKPKFGGVTFVDLLDSVSLIDREMRIRFVSPHPKDFPDDVLHLIQERDNICKNIHLPAQSGNNRILKLMRRGYTVESYLRLVETVRDIIPNVTLSSDFIVGFCGETEEEFNDTLALMDKVQYHVAYVFPFSMRQKTRAFHRMVDDVPHSTKILRGERMIAVFREHAARLNSARVGSKELVLVEGTSKRRDSDVFGRSDGGIKVILPRGDGSNMEKLIEPGDYVVVKITDSSSQVLHGVPLHYSTLSEFRKAQPGTS